MAGVPAPPALAAAPAPALPVPAAANSTPGVAGAGSAQALHLDALNIANVISVANLGVGVSTGSVDGVTTTSPRPTPATSP